jgi:hypothetical protein
MTRELAIARWYLSPDRNTFWAWRDAGTVIAWRDGTTIAFRAELEAVLDRLAPQGLPPMDALVLFLAACRADTPLGSTLELQGTVVVATCAGDHADGSPNIGNAIDLMYAVRDHRGSHQAFQALASIVNSPAQIRDTPPRKAELAAAFFESSRPAVPAETATAILDELRRGLAREIDGGPFRKSVEAPFAWLESFAAGAGRINAWRIAIRQKTGLEQLPRPVSTEMPPADSIQALLKSLERDEELGGIVRLARNLAAALTLPRAVSQQDELPLGGVSDITNRGPLDRLLISELAQDDLTFTVRVALNEALYLRREAPPSVPPRRRMILIDSGLRMWGLPRIFATAAGMALAATRPRRDELAVYRARETHLACVDFNTREGLVAHLAALEPSAHPGAALPTFRRLMDGGSAGEAVLITGEDVWVDRSFRQALHEAELPLLYVVTVSRGGRLRLVRRTPQGTKLLRESQHKVEEFLEPAPRAAPLLDLKISPPLPAIVHVRPFPLLLPHPANAERMWPIHCEDSWLAAPKGIERMHGVLCITGDRRLTFWRGSHRAARQLSDTLPPGGLHWHDSGRSHVQSTAVIGQLPRGELSLLQFKPFLLHFDPAREKGEIIPLALRRKNPLGVAGHGGAVFIVFEDTVEVFAQQGGEPLETLALGNWRWNRDRFFKRRGDWAALSFDGRAAKFETVCHDAKRDLIGLFDYVGIDGPVGITRAGELGFFYDRRPAAELARPDGTTPPIVQPRLPPSDEYQLSAVSADGYRIVLSDRRSRTSLVVDLCNGGVTQFRGNSKAGLAMHLFSMINNVTLRKRFRSIGVENGALVLAPSQGGAPLRLIALHDLRLVPDTTARAEMRGFVETPSPQGTGYRLAVAEWNDGSRAFLDSRGLLHLKSSQSSIPELALVLFEGYVPGWCSDGRMWGTEYFTGDAPRTDPRVIYEEVLRPFVSHLR